MKTISCQHAYRFILSITVHGQHKAAQGSTMQQSQAHEGDLGS